MNTKLETESAMLACADTVVHRRLSSIEVARFREVAGDDTTRPGTRLKAIDFLAADANIFFTRKTKNFAQFVETGTRPRREIIRLLRKLQRAKLSANMTTAVRDRLIFIQSEEAYLRGASVVNKPQLFRMHPPQENSRIQNQPRERVIDPVISEALKRWREEMEKNSGNGQSLPNSNAG